MPRVRNSPRLPKFRKLRKSYFVWVMCGLVWDNPRTHVLLRVATRYLFSDKICFTLPTSPLSKRTLIPCGCERDLVKTSFTIPSVNAPVHWSFFNTIATLIPGFISDRLFPLMFLSSPAVCHFEPLPRLRSGQVLREISRGNSEISRGVYPEGRGTRNDMRNVTLKYNTSPFCLPSLAKFLSQPYPKDRGESFLR